MDLYLVSHGDALPQGIGGIESDEERPLSEEGRAKSLSLGRALRKRGIVFDLIVCSPLLRAVQTAAELRTVFELSEQQVETREELAPGGRPKKLVRYLNGSQASSIVLVGHQPDLSKYAGWLMGEKDVQINFAKSGAALIRIEGTPAKGNGVLMWLVTPEWLEG
jgi:phosphohistidine phosphatase